MACAVDARGRAQASQIKEIFDLFDTDGGGTIDRFEVFGGQTGGFPTELFRVQKFPGNAFGRLPSVVSSAFAEQKRRPALSSLSVSLPLLQIAAAAMGAIANARRPAQLEFAMVALGFQKKRR